MRRPLVACSSSASTLPRKAASTNGHGRARRGPRPAGDGHLRGVVARPVRPDAGATRTLVLGPDVVMRSLVLGPLPAVAALYVGGFVLGAGCSSLPTDPGDASTVPSPVEEVDASAPLSIDASVDRRDVSEPWRPQKGPRRHDGRR